MNINPFINLISEVISLYNFALMVWVIMSMLVSFRVINPFQPFVRKVMYILNSLIEPVLSRIRRYVPNAGGIDLSVIVLFLALSFIKDILYTYFYS